MMAPASAEISQALGLDNATVEVMLTSIFILGFAVGPLILGPASEWFGRRRVIQFGNLFYLVFNLVCAFSPNAAAFLVFRFVAGFGGSATLSVGAGVLVDLYAPEQRGIALSFYSLAPLLGPAIGPICGAFMAQSGSGSWKIIFYATSGACVLIQVAGLFFLRETYEPILLDQMAKQVSQETGRPTRTRFDTEARSVRAVIRHRVLTPFLILRSSIIVVFFALWMMGIYGICAAWRPDDS